MNQYLAKLQNAGPSQDVLNWWGDWYKKAVQSQEATNAMPFVFNSAKAGGAQSTNPLGVSVDPAAIKAMMYQAPQQQGANPNDPQAMRMQAAQQGGGLLQPGAVAPQQAGGDLLQQLLGLSPEVLMPLLQQVQAAKGL